MAWRRASARPGWVRRARLLAWSRASRAVTVRRSGRGRCLPVLQSGASGAQCLVNGEEREQSLADQLG